VKHHQLVFASMQRLIEREYINANISGKERSLMTIPHASNANMHRIFRLIYDNGTMTRDEILSGFPNREKDHIARCLHNLLDQSHVFLIDRNLFLSDDLLAHYEDLGEIEKPKFKPQIVQPRTTSEFTPLKKKNIPSATGTRGGEVRDVSFKNAGSDSVAKPYFRE
jgi:hypothetical protein